MNCTRSPQSGTLTLFGHFVDAGGGLPPGCPVLDPFAQPASFSSRGSFRAQETYATFPSCAAVGLDITAQLSVAGAVVASRTATLAIKP